MLLIPYRQHSRKTNKANAFSEPEFELYMHSNSSSRYVSAHSKLSVSPLLCFASSLPQSPLCLPSSSFNHIFKELHSHVAVLDVWSTCIPSDGNLRVSDDL